MGNRILQHPSSVEIGRQKWRHGEITARGDEIALWWRRRRRPSQRPQIVTSGEVGCQGVSAACKKRKVDVGVVEEVAERAIARDERQPWECGARLRHLQWLREERIGPHHNERIVLFGRGGG